MTASFFGEVPKLIMPYTCSPVMSMHDWVPVVLAGISFECGDLLASDLSNVGVLLLTAQCWDDAPIAKVTG
jgi:hypothetical protein